MNKTVLWIGILTTLLTCGCSKKQVTQPPSPVPVDIFTVHPKNIPFFIDTLGHFAAYNTVTVQAQVQGELTGLYFEEGQHIRAGDLLFTIDKRPYQAVLDQAIATLKQNEAKLAYTRSRQERYSGLVEEDFVSKLQYTQFVTELESQEAIIEENRAEIDQAAINVGYCTLQSPISGYLGKKLIDVGNIITDVGTKMVVVNQVSPLYIDFSIPERHFEIVHRNQQQHDLLIEIFIPNTDLRTHARLQMIDNTINPSTGMIALRGVLPNEDHFFWPQQFVRIRLIVDEIKNALSVPPQAIVATSQGEIVWVVNDDQTVCIRHVDLGEEYDGEVHIIHGLKPGDKVVTKGQMQLRNGKKVKVDSANQGTCS